MYRVYTDGGFGKPKAFRSKSAAIKFAQKIGVSKIYKINKKYHQHIATYDVPQSNPSSLMRKLRKGIRGHIKLSRGKLIIKT